MTDEPRSPGRPTDYRPEYCERVIEWGAQGKSKAWMAAHLGIAKQTLYHWEEAHPEFLDATTRAMSLSQAWWEDAGQQNMATPGFNASIWAKNMSNRFRDDWTDRQEHSGPGGGPVQHAHSIEIVIVDPAEDTAKG